ncbi:phasin family protein [Bradyrhizobium sp. CCGUVB1N3]|uniref:phasin family protein n=1 Tax=Bradyrhizobium sp. CCGUVB1N3 TaxID=2949629 RepID=UPI0020B1A5E6|nr:phasin family protein [Bradyrhizobium sp. CCGUVB1N3]MCP3470592.1 phasin family protein [Bradyrhizobium sp. CCGUVB1N3]
MNESEAKVEVKAANGSNGFGLSAFGLPNVSWQPLFEQLAEQRAARTQEGCEKIKAVSQEATEALRETYSNSARTATDYGLKVIEISNANASSAIDFLARVASSKSMTDVFTTSAAEARRAFDAAAAQNRQLWELAQRLATQSGEPIRQHVAKVFQKAS